MDSGGKDHASRGSGSLHHGLGVRRISGEGEGCITPGKLADMVILSNNIFGLKPETIRNVKVETTIVGGKVVYGLSR